MEERTTESPITSRVTLANWEGSIRGQDYTFQEFLGEEVTGKGKLLRPKERLQTVEALLQVT